MSKYTKMATAIASSQKACGPFLKKTAVCLLTSLFVTGCANTASTPMKDVPEVLPGYLQGYLPRTDLPDSLAMVPPPPAKGSVSMKMDEEAAKRTFDLRGTSRWQMAIDDADLLFPHSAGTFSCALNAPITKEETPHLYRLLRRTFADATFSTDNAKNQYKRPRPFMVNGETTCTPDSEDHLKKNGSYPSGHTAIGWAWALVLAELSPEHQNAIFARGRAFGDSRSVCNAHWQSDVIEGRHMGAATIAKLHSNPEFMADFNAAKAELAKVQAKGLKPTRDCIAEEKTMALNPDNRHWPANS